MSADFNKSDLARLLALEYAFTTVALLSASNFAYLANTTTSEAVAQFRQATESAMYDGHNTPPDVRDLMREHLRRWYDHIAAMAKQADLGIQSSKEV